MKIIIPMTGYGSRFVSAGYERLKPFIEVQGKPIIQWIVEKMYSSEDEFLFICRKEHLEKYPYIEEILRKITSRGKIASIENWVKKGPIYDVLRCSQYISNDEAYIINYCDFYMTWDYEKFKKMMVESKCDGAVPCYSGFHPHLIPDINVYASCKTDEYDNLLEIREKYSFEKDKMQSKHSPGNYYFKNGKLLKKYSQKMIDAGDMLKGEFYASLPFNYMIQDGLKVLAPVIVDQFCQWGTPEDLQEYLFWTECVRRF